MSLPPSVRAYVDAATARTEEHFAAVADSRHGYVASDPTAVHDTLAAIAALGLARGESFCEWGSGSGMVAGIAAMLGFRSAGIEVQPDLVALSVELAEEFSLEVEYAVGTFVPDPALLPAALDRVEHPWWNVDAADGHAELGLDPAEVDVVFAYPWPGERPIFEGLFRDVASEGALLVTHSDGEGTRVVRLGRDGTLAEVRADRD